MGIRVNESNWMKKYIYLITDLRTKATNDLEKDLYKLMNNALFGKTCENIEKRVDIKLVTHEIKLNNIKLVTHEIKLTKLASNVNYNSHTVFDEGMIAVHRNKLVIEYNKPLYLGMCILDVSKSLIYRFITLVVFSFLRVSHLLGFLLFSLLWEIALSASE
jgi:hypothetical protein